MLSLVKENYLHQKMKLLRISFAQEKNHQNARDVIPMSALLNGLQKCGHNAVQNAVLVARKEKWSACLAIRAKDIPIVDVISDTSHQQLQCATPELVHHQHGKLEDGVNATQNVDTDDRCDELSV